MRRRKSELSQVRNKGKIIIKKKKKRTRQGKKGGNRRNFIGEKGKAFKINIIGYIFNVIKSENIFTRSPLQRLFLCLKMPKNRQLPGPPLSGPLPGTLPLDHTSCKGPKTGFWNPPVKTLRSLRPVHSTSFNYIYVDHILWGNFLTSPTFDRTPGYAPGERVTISLHDEPVNFSA